MIFNSLKILLIVVFLPIFITSCATLNKDECRTANWKLIGYEDGSKGYTAARIGEHRKACAEYGVSPNLDLYNKGRAEGLHKYCIPVNGYNLGQRGAVYQGICAGYNEQGFVAAYKHGTQLRAENSRLHQMQRILDQKQKDLDHIITAIKNKEQQIVAGELTTAQTVLALVEVKELAVKQGILIKETHDLQAAVKEQAYTIAQMKQQYQY